MPPIEAGLVGRLRLKLESEFHQKMDGQTKLSRTNSSLLRSSIHSLSSVSDSDAEDLEEQKPHSRPLPPPVRSGAAAPVAAAFLLLLLLLYALFAFFTSDENLLSALIFVAIFLFLLSRNKGFVSRNVNLFKQIRDEKGKRFGFLARTHSKPVQRFIGEAESEELEQCREERSSRKIVREGVVFYSNGDFYEGEFHKGTCNGSGVYNYFVNGRYEGDWIDGKYDGYGIESRARGGRYRGQYRQGLRHGYGVYKFYTGVSCAGEWCNGQMHGVGAQTCGDGTCFVGEFKCGVKHGLGCYHFRNGDRYAGEYFGNKIHGFGVYHYANGHFYEGSWHEGRKQGYGMYTFLDGEARCGEWDNGNLSIPLAPLTDAVRRAVQVNHTNTKSQNITPFCLTSRAY